MAAIICAFGALTAQWRNPSTTIIMQSTISLAILNSRWERRSPWGAREQLGTRLHLLLGLHTQSLYSHYILHLITSWIQHYICIKTSHVGYYNNHTPSRQAYSRELFHQLVLQPASNNTHISDMPMTVNNSQQERHNSTPKVGHWYEFVDNS